MGLTGNVGEWSEVYVLLSLIAAGSVQIVDEEFRPTGSTLGLVTVERGQTHVQTSYRPDAKRRRVRIEGGGELRFVDIDEIEDAARRILAVLQKGGGKSGIPEIEVLLAKLRVSKLAASSGSKSDIRLVVQDSKTSSRLDLPMSIKSLIGSPPSLLNASGATNFELAFACTDVLAEELLALGRAPKKIIQRAIGEGLVLESAEPVNTTFRSNSVLSDSAMPKILGELLLQYYSGSSSDMLKLISQLAERDPLAVGVDDSHRYYLNKMRNFLADVALGMTPSVRWDGRYSASGGYLVVKPSGDVVCLYAADRDNFRDYLLSHTRLETGDTKKHGFGEAVKGLDGMVRILLNLQIRFKL